jgi:cytochrome c-type biogenesis protein CcmH/NrfF
MLVTFSHIKLNQLLAMLALNKTTAAKLLVLWNLPVLLLLAGAFEVGSSVMV